MSLEELIACCEAPDVSIIVVSYNTRDMTMACLDSVLAETRDARYELIVVDNASSDGSAEAIANHPSKPKLIALKDNIGFAAANNLAAGEATGRYLLLLNPDTVVLGRAIDRLVSFAKLRPDAGIWGGRTLFADGRLNPASAWGRMTPWNLLCRATGLTAVFKHTTMFNGEAMGGWRRERASEREVDIVSGCFLLITHAFWTRLDGFDPAFFMYGEEADLCLRARKIGARPRVTPAATIIHYGGASERARSDKMVKLLKGKITLIERRWHPLLVPIGTSMMALWPLSRWLATTVLSRLSSKAAHAEVARTWHEIWTRRDAWRAGYATPATVKGPKLQPSPAG